ncbi:MAG: TapB family protein [Sulfuricella sp.]
MSDIKQRSRLASASIRFGLLGVILLLPTSALAVLTHPLVTWESFFFPFKDGDSWTYEVSDKQGARLVTKAVLPGSIEGCMPGWFADGPPVRPAKILQGSDGSRSYVSSADIFASAAALCHEERLESNGQGGFKRVSTEYASASPLYFFGYGFGLTQGSLSFKEDGVSVGQGTFSETIYWPATEDVTVPAGTFSAQKFAYTIQIDGIKNNRLFSSHIDKTIWAARNVGIVKEILNVDGEISTSSLTATNFSLSRVLSAESKTVSVVEFYNTQLNHYFMTADPAEMDGIDRGSAGLGWVRTGLSFNAYTLDSGIGEKAAVCRFYGDMKLGPDGKRIGPNSHFYTANAFECEGVKASPGWMYEALAFSVSLPIEGICERGGGGAAILAPDTLRPVYRAYNNRYMFNDSNHRYTPDIAVYQTMINQGWIGEGVVFCVP